MKGCDGVFPAVMKVYRLARDYQVDLTFAWHPRTEAAQVQADTWSKEVDGSEWVLNPLVFEWVLESPELHRRRPTLDAFASTNNAKAALFYSKTYCEGTLGIDGLVQSWKPAQAGEERPLVWANGSFREMGEIIRKVAQEKVDCLLVYPDWPRYWRTMLTDLPVAATHCLGDCPRLKGTELLCSPSSRVPPQKHHGKRPLYPVFCALVLFP